jgi:hypothetical protein
MTDVLMLCFSKSVVRRAAISALVVGSILILINHFEAIVSREMGYMRLLQIALTMVIPYIVSTVSSVITIQEYENVNRVPLESE